MAKKKTTAAKAASKKPRVGKANTVAKKAVAKKTTPKAKATANNALKTLAALPKTKKSANTNTKRGESRAMLESFAKNSKKDTRNQPSNPALDIDNITLIANAFNSIREILEAAAVNLRAKDRERLNGVGIKRQGFIERAFTLAADNVNFLPRYLAIEQFQQSFEYFISLRALFDSCTQLREFIWNLVVEAADITFVDAGEFYKSVQEAARRRIDGAESIYSELAPFFKPKKRMGEDGEEAETKKKDLRDFKALLNNKRDGKMVIENVKPKLTGGTRKIIDEKFTDSASFKETEDGELKE